MPEDMNATQPNPEGHPAEGAPDSEDKTTPVTESSQDSARPHESESPKDPPEPKESEDKRGKWKRCEQPGCKKKHGHDGEHTKTKVRKKGGKKKKSAAPGPDMFGVGGKGIDPSSGEIPIEVLADTEALGMMAAGAVDTLAVVGTSMLVGPELGSLMSAPPEAQKSVAGAFKVWIDAHGVQMTPGQMVLAAIGLAYAPSGIRVGMEALKRRRAGGQREAFEPERPGNGAPQVERDEKTGATVEKFGGGS